MVEVLAGGIAAWAEARHIRVAHGSHGRGVLPPDVTGCELCIMEIVAAYSYPEKPVSDEPDNVHDAIRCLMVSWNDKLPSDQLRAQWLLPLADVVVGTANSDAELQYMIADCACRELAPLALDSAGLTEQATLLRSLAEVVDKETANAARAAADAAAAAYYAADAAAYAAAAYTDAAAAAYYAAAAAAYYAAAAYTDAAAAAYYAAAAAAYYAANAAKTAAGWAEPCKALDRLVRRMAAACKGEVRSD